MKNCVTTLLFHFIVIFAFSQSTNSNFFLGIWEDARGPLYPKAQTELANFKNNNVLVWTNQDSSQTACTYSFDSLNNLLMIVKPTKMDITVDTIFYEVRIINQSEIELYPKRIIFYNRSENKWINQEINFEVFNHFKRRFTNNDR
jgi:hypothetical protein